MKTQLQTKLPPKVLAAMKDFYESVEPAESLRSLLELLRMLGQSDIMQESDPAGESFYRDVYHWIRILDAMADHRTTEIEAKVKDLELQVARLSRKKAKLKPQLPKMQTIVVIDSENPAPN